MEDTSTVNDQITDSVTQNVTLLTGSAATQGVGMVDVVSAETIGMFMHNAVVSQQNSQLTSNASVTAACARMLNTQPAPPLKKEGRNPPPFMPLTTDSDSEAALISPDKLLSQAQALVESAVKSIGEQKTTDTNTEQAIEKMINILKGTGTDAGGDPGKK